ncbi:putative lipoprotein [Clostridium botulinum C str. Eklund]|nr:putative lipoprotein [Clostridium botulinum C str. Eklund]NEZ49000.1 hypothetical protein [Clostridium botulinum]
MRFRKLYVFFIFILSTIFVTSCGVSIAIDSSVPYKEEGSLTKTFETQNQKSLTINDSNSSLTIVKKPISTINITCHKTVGGKNEASVKDFYKKINYTIKNTNGELTIDSSYPKLQRSQVNNLNLQTYIEIPDFIENVKIINTTGNTSIKDSYKSINVASDVGNIHITGYSDTLLIASNVGNIHFDGSSKSANISSDVGNIEFNVDKLNKNHSYTFKNHVGNTTITLPKNSTINLQSKNNNIKIDDGIKKSNDGTKFLINDSSTGNIKINSK